jgi:hypothetical protein
VLAALGAEILAPATWRLRFAALAVFFGPFVAYAGSQLRDV